jgi:hypothetical protein
MDRRYTPSQIPKLFIYYTLPFPHCVNIISQKSEHMWQETLIDLMIFGVLMPFSTIFQLYHGDQF